MILCRLGSYLERGVLPNPADLVILQHDWAYAVSLSGNSIQSNSIGSDFQIFVPRPPNRHARYLDTDFDSSLALDDEGKIRQVQLLLP